MKGLLLILALPFVFAACQKDESTPAPTTLQLNLSHGVLNAPLIFDSLMYLNRAAETYSISRLNYFLSDITFYQSDAPVYTLDTIAYIDAKNSYTLIIPECPAFSYDSIGYSIGVPASRNSHGKLPPTYENVAMEWPDAMGGGYHFLKLEGHWRDAASVAGFTVHLGTNPYLVHGGFKVSGQITAHSRNPLSMKMNVGEWLERPYTFSFGKDGVYTMGNAALMQRIVDNGHDVIQMMH